MGSQRIPCQYFDSEVSGLNLGSVYIKTACPDELGPLASSVHGISVKLQREWCVLRFADSGSWSAEAGCHFSLTPVQRIAGCKISVESYRHRQEVNCIL